MSALLISLVFTVVVSAGCDHFKNEQNIPESLVGEWQWYKSVGGWIGEVSADTAGYSMMLRVYSQDEAKWFRDDTLMSVYDIKFKVTTAGEKYVMTPRENSVPCNYSMDLIQDKTELRIHTIDCMDVPEVYFKRTTSK